MKDETGKQAATADGLPSHVTGRRREVLAAAARVFAKKGYKATSMRDIGRATGLLGGSLYHHIRSKDDLFVELHDAALEAAAEQIAQAATSGTDPWDRLSRACTRLLEIRLDPRSITMPVMNDFRAVPPDIQNRLLEKRDAFEAQFRELVEALPLPAEFDRSTFRNFLLSSINSAPDWVGPGRYGPEEIAEQLLLIFRH